MAEMCANAFFFRTRTDLCMNFAALAFVLELDDMVVVHTYYRTLKTEYNLFSDDKYEMYKL